jgi:hypothetical protein
MGIALLAEVANPKYPGRIFAVYLSAAPEPRGEVIAWLLMGSHYRHAPSTRTLTNHLGCVNLTNALPFSANIPPLLLLHFKS